MTITPEEATHLIIKALCNTDPEVIDPDGDEDDVMVRVSIMLRDSDLRIVPAARLAALEKVARAYRHGALGELEGAVRELEELDKVNP